MQKLNCKQTILGKCYIIIYETINSYFDGKQHIQGSITELQKVQSLQGCWFKVIINNVERINNDKTVGRTVLIMLHENYQYVCIHLKNISVCIGHVFGQN